MGVRGPSIISPRTRLQGFFVWDILDFIINASLFALIGLQLRTVVDGLSGFEVGKLAGWGLAVSGTVVVVRFLWMFTMPYAMRLIYRSPAARERRVGARQRVVVAWSGMRGAVSLAAALALPPDFPQRDVLVFLTFAVIFATLVLQGLTLAPLIRVLGVTDDGSEEEHEELKARLVATKAALGRIEELKAEDWTRDDTMDRLQRQYEYRKRRLAARAGKIEDDGYEDRSFSYQTILREVLEAQRAEIVRLRNQGTISNEVMHRLERELDLEDERLEI